MARVIWAPFYFAKKYSQWRKYRHGLLITRVTKTILNDNVKWVHGPTIVDALLIYLNIHGTVKTREYPLHFPNLAQTASYINGIISNLVPRAFLLREKPGGWGCIISTNLGYLRFLNRFLFSEENIRWIFRGIRFILYIKSAHQIKIN